ncbi:hypothetical protein LTR95_009555 [Oleoguttula sp. CCFEE 5521]
MGDFFDNTLPQPLFGVGPLGPGTYESPISSIPSLGYEAPLGDTYADTEVFADGHLPGGEASVQAIADDGNLPLVSLEQLVPREDSAATTPAPQAVTQQPLRATAADFSPSAGPASPSNTDGTAEVESQTPAFLEGETDVEDFPAHTFGGNGTAPAMFARSPPARGDRGSQAPPLESRNGGPSTAWQINASSTSHGWGSITLVDAHNGQTPVTDDTVPTLTDSSGTADDTQDHASSTPSSGAPSGSQVRENRRETNDFKWHGW